ncbi:MAG: hypothetical protein ABI761_19280 [Saprospiraceae bacterium]
MFYIKELIRITFSLALSCLFFFNLPAQDSIQPKLFVRIGYGSQSTIHSDLSKRYGQHGTLSLGINFIKHHWETGPAIGFLFGSNVREDVLASLRSADGELIGSDHQLAEVDLNMRGMMIGWSILRKIKLSTQSFFLVGLQPVWLSHWIRFQNPGNSFEPIQGNYRYGYDRLSSGLAIEESLTYRFQSNNRLLNLELAFTAMQGNSSLRRNIQLDNPSVKKTSSSGFIGFQARWLVPIFPAKKAEKIFY